MLNYYGKPTRYYSWHADVEQIVSKHSSQNLAVLLKYISKCSVLCTLAITYFLFTIAPSLDNGNSSQLIHMWPCRFLFSELHRHVDILSSSPFCAEWQKVLSSAPAWKKVVETFTFLTLETIGCLKKDQVVMRISGVKHISSLSQGCFFLFFFCSALQTLNQHPPFHQGQTVSFSVLQNCWHLVWKSFKYTAWNPPFFFPLFYLNTLQKYGEMTRWFA